MQRVLSSQTRLEAIVNDIIFDMEIKPRLQNGRGNALLVASSVYEACKYYELFQERGFDKCAIITSYVPSSKDLKGESTGEYLATDKLKKYKIYTKMLNDKFSEYFEKDVKRKFVEEPAQMRLLIVVDKLLTGFDAPSATYLYIDKSIRDHGLFQAICRVNRLDGDDKEYGYIVDYKDLFGSLESSISDYTAGAFDEYEQEDVSGLLSNRLEQARKRLDQILESIKALCEPVEPPKDTLAYIRYFCGENTEKTDELKENEQKRPALYKLTIALLRAYAHVANEMEEAGYLSSEIATIKTEVKYYENVSEEIKRASGDHIDLKAYEPAMRYLIDTYIRAEESETVSTFDDLTLIELIIERGTEAVNDLPKGIREDEEAIAETIENNVRRLIIDEIPTNPKYYEDMSKLLDSLINERKMAAKNYEEYLSAIIDLTKKASNPSRSSHYPSSMNTNAKRALYDNLNQDEEFAMKVDQAVKSAKRDNWRGKKIKEREVKYKVKDTIEKHLGRKETELVDLIFEIVKKQGEY